MNKRNKAILEQTEFVEALTKRFYAEIRAEIKSRPDSVMNKTTRTADDGRRIRREILKLNELIEKWWEPVE